MAKDWRMSQEMERSVVGCGGEGRMTRRERRDAGVRWGRRFGSRWAEVPKGGNW